MNDSGRAEWVGTSLEGFYRDQRRSRLGMTAYVRANRADIDAAIRSMPGTEALFRANDRRASRASR
jgi:hypothetical protein